MKDNVSDRQQTFEELFRDNSDPWDFETSDYERDKRRATIESLGGRQFEHMLEIGCATGVLTQELAACTASLLAIDVSKAALKHARERLRHANHVRFRQAEVPLEWPDGEFDAIVLSEVLYFLSPEEIQRVSRLAYGSLNIGGICLLVNWTGENDCAVDGDEAVRIFQNAADWTRCSASKAPSYRMDRLTL